MDLNYKQEITVGGLVLVAIVLFIVGTTWLSGRSISGDTSDYWHIQFENVGGLKVSSSVRVSGVPIGRVEEVKLIEPGKVLVGVSLDEAIVPRVDATAFVSSIGFVGDAVVDLDPGRASQARQKSQVIMGSQQVGLMDRAGQLSNRADSVLIGAQAIVNEQTAKQLQATLTALQGTLKATERMMNVYGDPRHGPTAELTATMTSFRQVLARFDSTLGSPALARTLNRTDTLTSNLAAMSAQSTVTLARLDSLLAAINRGQGTMGKLVTDSTFYYELRRLSGSMADFINNLKKHPGKISPTFKFCC